MSGTICGLYDAPREGQVTQIVAGFAGRMAEELHQRGGIVPAFPFNGTALAPFNPRTWKETADDLVTRTGVRVYLHTLFAGVIRKEDRITAVIVENKEGRGALIAPWIVDASGDGNVAFRAGIPYTFGREGTVQAPSMVFRMTGINWDEALKVSPGHIEEMARDAVAAGAYDLPRTHMFLFPQPHPEEGLMNVTRVLRADGTTPNTAYIRDLTEAEIAGRRQITEYARFLVERVPGFQNARVVETAAELGIRQTRSITCRYRLRNDDVAGGRKFENAIARSAWPVEVHEADGTRIHILHDDWYEIPFDVMVPVGMVNLLVAGRCICAEHEALASARVTAQCMEEGMAAALAVRQAAHRGGSGAGSTAAALTETDVGALRTAMRERGALL